MKSTAQKFLAFVYAVEKVALDCVPCGGCGTVWPNGGHAMQCQPCAPIRAVLLQHKGLRMSMDLETPKGAKVIFHHPRNGQSGDIKTAKEKLTIGAEYTVARIDVFDYSSNIYLVEVPGVAFNTVQFANTPLVFP